MDTDGGGWTLVAWTGNSATSPYGVPYPGLAVCQSLNCLRGSTVGPQGMQALFQAATAIAQAQSQNTMANYGTMSAYQYAGKYVYQSLAQLTLNYAATTCNNQGLQLGTFTSLVGPNQYDGSPAYLAQHLSYASYDYSSDSNSYIYNIGNSTSYCSGSGTQPGGWLGTWNQGQWGPYMTNTIGAYSVWVK